MGATAERLSIYTLMEDHVLDAALRELELVLNQPGFKAAPPKTQNYYLGAHAEVLNEINRRRM